MSTHKMQCKCGLWCAILMLQAVYAVYAAQMIKDDSTIVVPSSVPVDDLRPMADHRRMRNVSRTVGAPRRPSSSSSPAYHQVAAALTPLEAPENAEPSMPRVKKKIKHKRMWDEPEAQASEAQNATSKRPDRIKTRRRLLPSSATSSASSSTARTLRTTVVSRDDPYYDFGKKIKHASSSSPIVVHGMDASPPPPPQDSPQEMRATTEPQSDADVTSRDKPSARTRMPLNRNYNHSLTTTTTTSTTVNGFRRPEGAECAYHPRFVRRNNKQRSRRDAVRCPPPPSPAEPADARTTRILSTVVTSVSVRGNAQPRRNDTGASSSGDAAAAEGPASATVSPAVAPTNPAEPAAASSTAHPKYLRNRYRNISLPEYLEITRVNQRRLNGTTAETARLPPSVSTQMHHAVQAHTTASTTAHTAGSTAAQTTESTAAQTTGSSREPSTGDDDDVATAAAATAATASDNTPSPPTDLQDFIYLSNGTSEAPPPPPSEEQDTTTAVATAASVEARQRRPVPRNNNVTRPSPTEHDVGVVYSDGLASSAYLLTFLAVIVPLVLVIAFAVKLAVRRNKKKKVFDSSEYSSEYNRSPLDFNTITSSPITTKLPRVPQHIVWDAAEKTSAAAAAAAAPLPSNSRWEFPRDKLRLQTILGQGNFGQVWKAEADDISGHEGLTRLVAVKMVKEDAASREREDLIRELSIMQHLGSHPNVVTLLGCCTEKEPYLLIMEYVMYGKLLAFLRDRRTRSHYFNFSDSTSSLTSRDLTVFAYCVARGMDFLVSKKIVHRDLAARNVLVDHNKLCKIADFGMSRNVRDTNQIYEQRHTKGALPIRWMAPESLHYSIFTYKTDVWSFGILMWEIVTLGSTPYCTMGAREVMRRVREGYRLDKPAHCRSELFRVITKCWAADPSKRPTFADLKQELGALLENPEFEGSYVDLESLVDESDGNAKDRQ